MSRIIDRTASKTQTVALIALLMALWVAPAAAQILHGNVEVEYANADGRESTAEDEAPDGVLGYLEDFRDPLYREQPKRRGKR